MRPEGGYVDKGRSRGRRRVARSGCIVELSAHGADTSTKDARADAGGSLDPGALSIYAPVAPTRRQRTLARIRPDACRAGDQAARAERDDDRRPDPGLT